VKQNSRTLTRTRKFGRIGAAVASMGLLFAMSACGFDAQTLQPYTPSDGVNVDVGVGPNGEPDSSTVKVRSLMILAKSPTSGFLSATLYSQQHDSLTQVTGNVLNPNGSEGAPITAKLSSPVQISGDSPVVLIDDAPITVTASRLPAGQTATLTLTFSTAGTQEVRVPIVDGNNDIYATVQPSPPSAG
jgi:hypothetical protein